MLDMLNEGNLSLDESHMPWKIELLGAPGSAESSFVGRQQYHDKLKVRGIGLPERAVIEGEFGTKAEAEAHADFAIDSLEMSHEEILEDLNNTLIDDLLRLNFGKSFVGKVRVQAAPLADDKKQMIRELYTNLLNSEEYSKQEYAVLDRDAIREHLKVPVIADAQNRNELQDIDAEPVTGSSEFADKSRLQQKRNKKAIDEILQEVESGERTAAIGEAMLQTYGLAPDTAKKLIESIDSTANA